MLVPATNLDNQSLGEVDLTRSPDGRAAINGQVVLAMRPIGSRVALIADSRQYCIATVDYWRVMGTAHQSRMDEQAA